VEGGGVEVVSGGLSVDGGLLLRSGHLELAAEEGLRVGRGGIQAVSQSHGVAAVDASVTSHEFRGAVVHASSPVQSDAHTLFAGTAGGSSVFSVDGTGAVQATALAVDGTTHAKGDLTVRVSLNLSL
jgi:hypothetical protein